MDLTSFAALKAMPLEGSHGKGQENPVSDAHGDGTGVDATSSLNTTSGPRCPLALCPMRETSGCLVNLVQSMVANLYDVDLEALRGTTRGRAPVAQARQVAMYLCHVALGYDYRAVGVAFGRDRTTAVYACRIVEDLRDNQDLDRRLAVLEAMFQSVQRGIACARCRTGREPLDSKAERKDPAA